ncbi:hypothetical protein M1O51_04920, partial [Dehalococcoidia bacterium]|nr:hypothetical protein [Dehalococcoidia bacterium]
RFNKMPDWDNYITVASSGQSGEVTYTKPRGYHHWTCLKCHKWERERGERRKMKAEKEEEIARKRTEQLALFEF